MPSPPVHAVCGTWPDIPMWLGLSLSSYLGAARRLCRYVRWIADNFLVRRCVLGRGSTWWNDIREPHQTRPTTFSPTLPDNMCRLETICSKSSHDAIYQQRCVSDYQPRPPLSTWTSCHLMSALPSVDLIACALGPLSPFGCCHRCHPLRVALVTL